MKNFEFIKSSNGITEYKLASNGLTVLLLEDHSAPVATFMVTYLVGSRNEAIGYTGATHLLEHLMFKGSKNYNKENGKTIWTTLQNIGARINATTWLDRTNYFEMLPSNQLEIAISIEADRMRHALLRDSDRQPEMTVVRNEFERGENDPWDALDKHVWATAYQAHPYHHSTIGWRSDIEGVSTDRLREFYDTYYWPNNATVTVIGDLDTEQTLKWIEQYFGHHPSSPSAIPDMYTTEPKQEGARRFTLKRSGETGIIGIAHKTPDGKHDDQYPLSLLSNILGTGKTSRFYRRLIDKGLASSVYIWNHPFHDNSLFSSYAFLTPDTPHQKVEEIILEEYAKILKDGVTEKEIQPAKAQVKADLAYSRDGSYSIASALNEAIAMGDWTFYTTYLERMMAVTNDDIKRVAAQYLVEDQSTTGWFIPVNRGNGDRNRPSPSSIAPNQPAQFSPSPGAPSDVASSSAGGNHTRLAHKVKDVEPIKGLRLVSMPMNVTDVVTLSGSFYGGEVFAIDKMRSISDLTVAMIDKGTAKRDKFEISAQLEAVGAQMHFSADDYRVNFSARCLKDDVPLVIELLGEQLQIPAFNEDDLKTLKTRLIANLKRQSENTDFHANLRFSQLAYPKNHPNYLQNVDDQIADIEKITCADLRTFHGKHYGLGSFILVATGDIDQTVLEIELQTHFSNWQFVNIAVPDLSGRRGSLNGTTSQSTVSLPEKTSADMVLGLVTGIHREHPDFLALSMGSFILGGNFAARLMATVRDDEGLTYGIGSSVSGAGEEKDGYWAVSGTFSPELLKQGRESTMLQVKKWVKGGITEEELTAKKTTLIGSYQVGLGNTKGVAVTLLDTLERGKPINYIDTKVDEVNALTLDQINGAIRKYIDLDRLIFVAAGTINDEWEPAAK